MNTKHPEILHCLACGTYFKRNGNAYVDTVDADRYNITTHYKVSLGDECPVCHGDDLGTPYDGPSDVECRASERRQMGC